MSEGKSMVFLLEHRLGCLYDSIAAERDPRRACKTHIREIKELKLQIKELKAKRKAEQLTNAENQLKELESEQGANKNRFEYRISIARRASKKVAIRPRFTHTPIQNKVH